MHENLNKTSCFNYYLPEELIAQTPIEPRDASRLLVLNKKTGELIHNKFSGIIDYLSPSDCLIFNDSKVIPARIFGVKEGTGAKVEFLLLKQIKSNAWEALAKPGKRAKVNSWFEFGSGILKARIVEVTAEGNKILEFKFTGDFFSNLDKIGAMPLPPYIKEKLKDRSRYQTVYAKDLGSAAAPTAGLHFTKALIDKIREKGIKTGFVTLHVGLGTFKPVKAENVNDHKMHSEYYEIPPSTAELINKTKLNGGKVVAVGTTTCRTLESCMQKCGKIEPGTDKTNIFIKPGYEFKAIDSIITNFHLPQSTLVMLVAAFAGYNNTFEAYAAAVKEKYRFFSFGDAMLII